MSRSPRTTTLALLGRTLRTNVRSVLALSFLTLLFTVVAVVVPQVVTGVLTQGVRYDLQQSTFLERDVSARIPNAVFPAAAGSEPTDLTGELATQWGGFDGAVSALRSRLPEPLRSATGRPEYNVTSDQLLMDVPQGATPKLIQLTTDPRLYDRITIAAGSKPAPFSPGAVDFDILLSPGNAGRMHWAVGQTRTFTLQEGTTLTVRLSGTYRITDQSDPYWRQTYDVNALTGNAASAAIDVEAAAFIDPRSLPALATFPSDFQTKIWYPTEVSAFSLATTDRIAEQSRHFTAIAHTVADASTTPVAFSSDLGSLLDASSARTATALSVIIAIFAGSLGAAIALEVLVIRLGLIEARRAVDLVAGRGASPARLRGTVALIAAIAAIPAAAVGLLVGCVLNGSTPNAAGSITAAVAALVPLGIGAALVPSAFPRQHPVRIRPFVEAVIVVATLVAVVLTVRSSTTAATSANVDPVAIALPLLLALTGCVVTARAIPVLLRRALPRLRRRPGIAAFTGAAIVARGSGGTAVTLLAALIAVAVALFGSVFGTTLVAGLETAGAASVGSSVSVQANTLNDDIISRMSHLPGVEVGTGITNEQVIPISNRGNNVDVTVIIADTAALAKVQKGVAGSFPLPSALRATGDTVPVIASQDVSLQLGISSSSIAGTPIRILATEPSQTALTASRNWILLDTDQADAIDQGQGSANEVLLRLSPRANASSVASSIAQLTGDSSLTTTAQNAIDRLEKNPVVPGMRTLAIVDAVLAGLIGILALLLTSLQETPARRSRIALLSMLGLDRRQGRRILAVEALPLGIAALLGGTVVAAAIVAVVLPAVDLRSFTGSATRPPVAIDPLVVVLILLGGAIAVGIVTLVTIASTTIRGADRRLSSEDRS